MKAKITEARMQSVKAQMSAQRYLIQDFLKNFGSSLTAERYENWRNLHNVLNDGARAVYELYELRNEALILAHELKRENEMLRDRLEQLISAPDV